VRWCMGIMRGSRLQKITKNYKKGGKKDGCGQVDSCGQGFDQKED